MNHLNKLKHNILIPNTHNTIPKINQYVERRHLNILNSLPCPTPENYTISSRPLTSLSTIKLLSTLPRFPLIRVSASVPKQTDTFSKKYSK